MHIISVLDTLIDDMSTSAVTAEVVTEVASFLVAE